MEVLLLFKETFWNSTVSELAQGYVMDEERDVYHCLICQASFENGVIYQMSEKLYEAKKAILVHIKESHGSMFDYLISMDKKYTGISEHQKDILQYLKQGLSDKEMVKELGGGSTSTIRNHRFKLREKEKQAKVFLAMMMSLAEGKEKNSEEFVSIHKGATMVDDRYAITEEEREKILKTYYKKGLEGPISSFPSKEKRKIIILQHIVKQFEVQKEYTESQINEVLKSIYSDFVTIRRYLIEYGFMERSQDCSRYWVKK
ncbi:DUF2087 domain-containing protein [Bacillus carboniphilus]|uniref:DUF2087 domain-containing protein n=1 Tax=Bacillus carboniphilus TaxID=86663 RepID=A0ABY9JRN7_9BACI|nr:DUF2087 domain-containing protein [Bacillus carboniphilus]WLR42069.1 DUF2087 domain-containing protein [Bacillus carboniphilus]